jgi:hypothetical protein
MIYLLAQAEPPPPELLSWLSVAGWIVVFIGGCLGIALAIKSLREKKSETPQPLIVKEHKRFATWEELQAVRAEVREIGTRFDEAVAQIRRDGEGRVAGIEQHLDALKGEIKGDNNTLHERITELLSAFAEFRGEARAKLSAK